MDEEIAVSAWIVLLMAVYALGAGLGELQRPGGWAAMLDECSASLAITFLTGMVLIAIGGAIYGATPAWGDGDGLDLAVKVMGGGIVAEGFAMLALRQTFISFARKIMGRPGRLWAALSILIGLALAAIAIIRI